MKWLRFAKKLFSSRPPSPASFTNALRPDCPSRKFRGQQNYSENSESAEETESTEEPKRPCPSQVATGIPALGRAGIPDHLLRVQASRPVLLLRFTQHRSVSGCLPFPIYTCRQTTPDLEEEGGFAVKKKRFLGEQIEKRFLSEVKMGMLPQTIWFYQEAGNTQKAQKELVVIARAAPSGAGIPIYPESVNTCQRRVFFTSTGPGPARLISPEGWRRA